MRVRVRVSAHRAHGRARPERRCEARLGGCRVRVRVGVRVRVRARVKVRVRVKVGFRVRVGVRVRVGARRLGGSRRGGRGVLVHNDAHGRGEDLARHAGVLEEGGLG